MSAQIILLLCFLNEGQFKAGFVKKLKHFIQCLDPDALPEVVSLTLYSIYIFFLMIIC